MAGSFVLDKSISVFCPACGTKLSRPRQLQDHNRVMHPSVSTRAASLWIDGLRVFYGSSQAPPQD